MYLTKHGSTLVTTLRVSSCTHDVDESDNEANEEDSTEDTKHDDCVL